MKHLSKVKPHIYAMAGTFTRWDDNRPTLTDYILLIVVVTLMGAALRQAAWWLA